MVLANDFERHWAEIQTDAAAAFFRVGASARYILGEEVAAFETALASWWGVRHAVGVASGLDALEISLRILGCGPGDRVLTTPLSAFATTLAILKLGAVPVFVDTDDDGLLDLAHCRRILSRDPIPFFVPVHLFGQPLDLPELGRLAHDFSLRMVEDCAQSIGALRGAEPTGSAGQFAAVSFYPTKNLGALGDAGAVLTNDGALAARARQLRDYGQTAKYRHEHVGYNSRLDELQAAILHTACLPRLEGWTRARRAVARAYMEGIRHPAVRLPAPPPDASPCWHLFPVYLAPERRADFLRYLADNRIQSALHYPVAIPDQPAMHGRNFEIAGTCDRARAVCAAEVSLPVSPGLRPDEIAWVVDTVNRWPG